MIQSKGLSIKYWEESIKCAHYIVNITPTNSLKNIALDEAWTEIELDVSHFHVFCSIAWAHNSLEKKKSLQHKIDKCIFVGYIEEMLNLMKISWSASLIQ
jgi:hypothetical protein